MNHTTNPETPEKSLHYQSPVIEKPLPSLKQLAITVKQMRQAQNSYFAASAKASKTRTSEDFAHEKECLEHSKLLEKVVDGMVAKVLQEGGAK